MDVFKFLSATYNPTDQQFDPFGKFKKLGLGQQISVFVVGVIATFPFVLTGPAAMLFATECFYRLNTRAVTQIESPTGPSKTIGEIGARVLEDSSNLVIPEVTNEATEEVQSDEEYVSDEKENIQIDLNSLKCTFGDRVFDFATEKDLKIPDEKGLIESLLMTKEAGNPSKAMTILFDQHGLVAGKARDDGDCLYSSLSQQLSRIENRPVTVKEIRSVLADKVLSDNALYESTRSELKLRGINCNDSMEAAKYIKEDASDYLQKNKELLQSRKELIADYIVFLKGINNIRKDMRAHIRNQSHDAVLKGLKEIIELQDMANECLGQIQNGLMQPLWGGDAEMQVISKQYGVQILQCSQDQIEMGFLQMGDDVSEERVCRLANKGAHFFPVWELNRQK